MQFLFSFLFFSVSARAMRLLLFQSLFGSFANCNKCSELSHLNNKGFLYSVLSLENLQISYKVSFVSICQLFCNLKSLIFSSSIRFTCLFLRPFTVSREMLMKDIVPKRISQILRFPSDFWDFISSASNDLVVSILHASPSL